MSSPKRPVALPKPRRNAGQALPGDLGDAPPAQVFKRSRVKAAGELADA